MDDILGQLGRTAVVLDLGAGSGSFTYQRYPCRIVAIDETLPPDAAERSRASASRLAFLRGDAAHLPLASGAVEFVIMNHVLEHLPDPARVLREVGRVLSPSGRLFVSVPDGYSFSDALYRFLFQGGGHVNRFSFDRLVSLVTRETGRSLLYAVDLYTSFCFVAKAREVDPAVLVGPARLLARVPSGVLAVGLVALNRLTHAIDRRAGTASGRYGWACYFGPPGADGDIARRDPYVNVCIRCGAGHDARWLRQQDRVGRRFGLASYTCPGCGARNPYFASGAR